MRLHGTVRCRLGIVGNSRTLIRSTGEPVELPNPLYELGGGMVAIPYAELESDDRVVIELTTWVLYDVERQRSTELVLHGSPGTDLMSRMATRYVREARELPQHELSVWAQHLCDEISA